MLLKQSDKQDRRHTKNKLPVYRIFGFNLASDFPFATCLSERDGPADLTFTCTTEPPLKEQEQLTTLFASSMRDENGRSMFAIFRTKKYHLMHFNSIADFYIRPEAITCHMLDHSREYLVEIFLLGDVISVWMELQGIPVLHASAVSAGGNAAAFISYSGGGKSSITGTLVKAGNPLLTDDILPVQYSNGSFICHPGYPQIRLWPEEAQHILGYYKKFRHFQPDLTSISEW